MLVAALAAMLLGPHDLVWCRGDAGHSALEITGVECCGQADVGAGCVARFAGADGPAGTSSSALSTGSCTDVALEPAGDLSRFPRAPERQGFPAPAFIALADLRTAGIHAGPRLADLPSGQAVVSLRSTVLTL